MHVHVHVHVLPKCSVVQEIQCTSSVAFFIRIQGVQGHLDLVCPLLVHVIGKYQLRVQDESSKHSLFGPLMKGSS